MQTRLVSCALELELGKIENDDFLHMANADFSNSINDNIEQFFSRIVDNDCDISPSMIKILSLMYKKLESIEKLLSNNNANTFTLPLKVFTEQIGHGIVILRDKILEIDSKYYARIKIDTLEIGTICFFATAKSDTILEITNMHQHDIKDYDMVVARFERQALRLRKIGEI